jgi:hypothetical protein
MFDSMRPRKAPAHHSAVYDYYHHVNEWLHDHAIAVSVALMAAVMTTFILLVLSAGINQIYTESGLLAFTFVLAALVGGLFIGSVSGSWLLVPVLVPLVTVAFTAVYLVIMAVLGPSLRRAGQSRRALAVP